MGKRYLPIKGPIYSFFGFWANVNGPKNREYRLVYTLENVNQWVQFGVGILFVQPMGLLLDISFLLNFDSNHFSDLSTKPKENFTYDLSQW